MFLCANKQGVTDRERRNLYTDIITAAGDSSADIEQSFQAKCHKNNNKNKTETCG